MRYVSYLVSLGLLLGTTPSYAQEQLATHHHAAKDLEAQHNNIKILIENAPKTIKINKSTTIRFKLVKNDKTLSLNDLEEVHTQKIHILMIDASLSDYHHIHPQEENKTQDFVFSFTPKTRGTYKMWVDITPTQTKQQEFIVTEIGDHSLDLPVKEVVALSATVGPYQFILKPEDELKAGHNVMATIRVTKNGTAFTQLEPVMGAYAHFVGFAGDRSSIIHIHPMGKEPNKTSDRGGPELMFHLKLHKKGFVKLFAQFRIDQQDIFVPFGINVK